MRKRYIKSYTAKTHLFRSQYHAFPFYSLLLPHLRNCPSWIICHAYGDPWSDKSWRKGWESEKSHMQVQKNKLKRRKGLGAFTSAVPHISKKGLPSHTTPFHKHLYAFNAMPIHCSLLSPPSCLPFFFHFLPFSISLLSSIIILIILIITHQSTLIITHFQQSLSLHSIINPCLPLNS